MKITITRALSELKTLSKRYDDAISRVKIVAVQVGTKLAAPNNMYKPEDFIKTAPATLQKANDIYKQIIAIKSGIDKSNSETVVTIGSKKMTVQEALVYKKYMPGKEELLMKLKEQKVKVTLKMESCQKEVNESVDALRKSYAASGKDKSIESVEEAVRKTSEVKLVDPCNLEKLIESLENEIDEFKTNVDFALSESNSTTFIEIDD